VGVAQMLRNTYYRFIGPIVFGVLLKVADYVKRAI
jgi:hypothetical protein